jgi:phage N-6-adenine-methyltransferase
MNTDLMFSSETDLWSTPQEFYDQLDKEFKFDLDPSCNIDNCKCEYGFWKEEFDGLKEEWHKFKSVFCNPPYGKVIGQWVKKAYEESLKGSTVVMLLPARTDTKWFHNYIYGKAEIRFVKGRLKFGGSKNSAPFPSMVVIYK